MIPIAKPILGTEEIESVTSVLKSGLLAEGKMVQSFENNFAEYTGTKYAVAVSSGTAALHAALLAHGIGINDEVITTPFSFIATANSIVMTGARPVFADIAEDTFNIDPSSIESKLSVKTKAILIVHLYGQPCDMSAIEKTAQKHNLPIIEDACQAHGAKYEGKKVGSFGTGCFSFYPTKNITTGEGGIITTNDKDIAEKARKIRNHGQPERYLHDMLGFNYRMTDISAAIGICQLAKVNSFNDKRIENAGYFTDALKEINGLKLPVIKGTVHHVFHQYTVRVKEGYGITRDELRNRLKEADIGTEVYYPMPIHKQPFYLKLGYNDHLPQAETAAREVLSLPVHPSLTKDELEYVVNSIKTITGAT